MNRSMTRTLWIGVLPLAWACNGGGDGDTEPLRVLDEAALQEGVSLVADNVPGCFAAPTNTSRTVAIPAVAMLRELARLPWPAAGTGSSGACGGEVTVQSEHANGITDYDVLFDAFCLQSTDGDVVIDGHITGREIGTPSDSGPVISAFEADTVGELGFTSPAGSFGITLTGARVDYGVPATWEPGVPDEASPDRVVVDQIAVTLDPSGAVDVVRDLELTRVGGLSMEITITGGQLGREGESFVNIRTPEGEPVGASLGSLSLTGAGSIRLEGAEDTVIVVHPGPSAGSFTFEVNGAAYPDRLDCGGSRQVTYDIVAALISALPLY